jgi:transposase
MGKKRNASSLISELKRKTRKAYNSEKKIRIVIEGIRGKLSIAELCRREDIHQANYYKWSKDFMEAGKHSLNSDTMREANTSEVQELKGENASLKELVADLSLEVKELKKNIGVPLPWHSSALHSFSEYKQYISLILRGWI